MYSKAELKKYSEMAATIKAITRVYEEAAARKVKIVQMEVDKLEEFISDSADTYMNVKFGLMVDEKAKKNGRKDILTKSFREVNQKTIRILIASHSNYFGNLITNLFFKWKEDMEKGEADGLILGATGERLLQKNQFKSHHDVETYDISDTNPEPEIILKAGQKVSNYSHVVCYYGAYKTVLTQVPESSEISNTITVGQVQAVKRYLFESGPEKILGNLEEDVMFGLLNEKIYKSQITKYAARIKTLEIGQVAEKMSQVMGDLSRGRRKVHKSLSNKKQLQLYTGVDLWSE